MPLAEGPSPVGSAARLEEWDELVDRFVRERFESHPHRAVQEGLHEFDGQLPDWSPSGLRSERRALRRARDRALAFGREELGERRRVERRYLLGIVERELFRTGTAAWPEWNPLYYLDALSPDVYVDRPYAGAGRRMRALTEHARGVVGAAAQIRTNLRPPLVEPCADLARTIFRGLASHCRGGARRAFEGAGGTGARRELDAALEAAAGALDDLADWLEGVPEAPVEEAFFGAGLMGALLVATEGLDVGMTRLESVAWDDLERNRAALEDACERWPEAAGVDAAVRLARRPGDGVSPVDEARRQIERLRRAVAERGLVTIPRGEGARVEEAPPHLRWNPAMIDIPGPCDEGVPAVFYIAPAEEGPSGEPRSGVPSASELLFMSAHEVWPGHYLHFLRAHDAPSPLARHFVGYGFAEGWAHYAEELARDAGPGEGRPSHEVAFRLAALLRDVRCVTALGLHGGAMGLDEAKRLFREEAHLSPSSARQQAARSSFDPECASYTLGKLVIRKLREDWLAGCRDGGDVRAFHDRLLGLGGPPLAVARTALTGDDDPAHLF